MRYILKRPAALLVAIGALIALVVPVFAQQALNPTPEDHVLGKADAPITIIEYASLTCPHCAQFVNDTMPQVQKEWIETGRAKLVFRHFPLDRAALAGAQLAECAGPDKFFAFLEVFFRQQDTWTKGDPIGNLVRLAKLGGMPEDKATACIADEKLANQIVAVRLQAEKELGVNSTPTFFVNGKKIVGAETYESFSKILEAAAKP